MAPMRMLYLNTAAPLPVSSKCLALGSQCVLTISCTALLWLIGGWTSWGFSTAQSHMKTWHTHINGFVWRRSAACWVQCQAPSWVPHRIKSSSVRQAWHMGCSHSSPCAPQTTAIVLLFNEEEPTWRRDRGLALSLSVFPTRVRGEKTSHLVRRERKDKVIWLFSKFRMN